MRTHLVGNMEGDLANNAKKLEQAIRELRKFAAQATADGLYGSVSVKILYENGVAQMVVRRLVDRQR